MLDNNFYVRYAEHCVEMANDAETKKEENYYWREYKKAMKIVNPEGEKFIRQERNKALNKQIKELIKEKKWKCICNSELKQSRSGSKILKCIVCGKKYKLGKKKK